MRLIGTCIIVFAICTTALAQFSTNMETKSSNWTSCVKPSCDPGGSGIPTKYSITETGSGWPPNSLKLSMTGPSWSNYLALDKVGATSASYFATDVWVYIPSSNGSNVKALEYDIFAFNTPYRYMWGSQCEIGGKWQIWDDLNTTWHDTSIICSLSQNQWHHLQWWVHRVPGDPSMHYDELGIDQVYNKINISHPAGIMPAGWSNDSGLNIQMDRDGNSGSKTLIEYVQHVNLTELN